MDRKIEKPVYVLEFVLLADWIWTVRSNGWTNQNRLNRIFDQMTVHFCQRSSALARYMGIIETKTGQILQLWN